MKDLNLKSIRILSETLVFSIDNYLKIVDLDHLKSEYDYFEVFIDNLKSSLGLGKIKLTTDLNVLKLFLNSLSFHINNIEEEISMNIKNQDQDIIDHYICVFLNNWFISKNNKINDSHVFDLLIDSDLVNLLILKISKSKSCLKSNEFNELSNLKKISLLENHISTKNKREIL